MSRAAIAIATLVTVDSQASQKQNIWGANSKTPKQTWPGLGNVCVQLH